MKEQKYILFDFDGTLADTMDLAKQIFVKIAAQNDFNEINDEDFRLIKTKRPQELMEMFGVSAAQLAKLVLQFRQEMGRVISELKPIAGIKEQLDKIKRAGYRMGILTSNSVDNVESFLQRENLRDFFDFIYSENKLFGKHTAIRRILKNEKIAKQNAVYVGDETRDVEASHKAGIPVVAVNWGFNSREILEEAKPNLIADVPEQLLDSINKIFA